VPPGRTPPGAACTCHRGEGRVARAMTPRVCGWEDYFDPDTYDPDTEPGSRIPKP
jgi:hypothetical protein